MTSWNRIPGAIRKIVPEDRYLVDRSAGQGQWALIPWTAVFDRLITTSARHGFYVVYLFRADLGGAYLSLNQGVTIVRETYGTDAKKSLRVRAADFRARIGALPSRFGSFDLELKVPSSSLGAYYEAGNICAAFYAAGDLPNEDTLVQDLQTCLDLYRILADKEVALTEPVGLSSSEVTEDLTRVRWHRRIDRDQRALQLVRKAKGHKCEVCGFDFEARYGELGRGFIEIHHLTPISELKGLVVSKNPERDYAALRSNCHSMIHMEEQFSSGEYHLIYLLVSALVTKWRGAVLAIDEPEFRCMSPGSGG